MEYAKFTIPGKGEEPYGYLYLDPFGIYQIMDIVQTYTSEDIQKKRHEVHFIDIYLPNSMIPITIESTPKEFINSLNFLREKFTN